VSMHEYVCASLARERLNWFYSYSVLRVY
jgi:hypothetical protein